MAWVTGNPELQEKLKQYIEECGSQNAAAKKIEVSPAALSTYLRGTYKGNIDNLENKLIEILETKESAENLQSVANATGYVSTSISTAVYETIQLCHLKGGLAIECGDAGIGKTMACKKYAEDHPNTAIYVTVNPCLASVVAFLKLLCTALNMPTTGRKDDMWLRLCERMRGERKVLIIDEAQHLPIKTIESIRAFFDSYPEIGVCLCGNIETYTNTGKSKEAFAQIRNRTKLSEIRHTQHIQAKDIALLFPRLAGQKKEIEFLLKIAKSEQGIRGAKNIYSNALDNENITHDGLVAMARTMRINVR